jgi:hypothetical protein
MHDAVDSARRVVALLPAAYFEDGRHTEAEWSSARVTDGHGGHRLVPVQVERCAVPRLLRPLLRAELFGVDEAEAVRRLLEAVRGPRRPDGAPRFPGGGRAEVEPGRVGVRPRLPGMLPPVWNLPPRNSDFVGRDALLAWLHERLRSGGAAVLHGLGGVGKTQVAIEYAYRYAGSYDLAWWAAAGEAGLIGEQYAALARRTRIRPRTSGHLPSIPRRVRLRRASEHRTPAAQRPPTTSENRSRTPGGRCRVAPTGG